MRDPRDITPWPMEGPHLRLLHHPDEDREGLDVVLKHLQHHMDDLMALAREADSFSSERVKKPGKTRGNKKRRP